MRNIKKRGHRGLIMNKHILVFTTAGSKKEASKLSKGLVKKKLAYCVNTIPAVQSTYLWEDKLCIDDEFLLIIKTQGKKFTDVEEWKKVNQL